MFSQITTKKERRGSRLIMDDGRKLRLTEEREENVARRKRDWYAFFFYSCVFSLP